MKNKGRGLGISMTIVLAGVIVIGAIMYSNNQNTTQSTQIVNSWTEEITNTGKHLLGDTNAQIIITEYSDTECPFCRNFHQTMSQLMNIYGVDGQLARVYKHFPLDSIHKHARAEAQASECVAQISGNETFWKFLDEVFNNQPSEDRALNAVMKLEVNLERFTLCVENNVFYDLVDRHHREGLASGIKGAPHIIVNTADGQEFVVSGAYPLEAMQIIIEMILAKKPATVIQVFIDIVKNGVTPDQMQAFLVAEFPRGLELLGIIVENSTAEVM